MVTQYANQPSAATTGGAEPVKTGMTGEEAWLLFAKVSFVARALVCRILNLTVASIIFRLTVASIFVTRVTRTEKL